jgi:hypothetical protein
MSGTQGGKKTDYPFFSFGRLKTSMTKIAMLTY